MQAPFAPQGVESTHSSSSEIIPNNIIYMTFSQNKCKCGVLLDLVMVHISGCNHSISAKLPILEHLDMLYRKALELTNNCYRNESRMQEI